MKRIREIEISETPPSGDKLWLKPTEKGIEVMTMLNGDWQEVTSSTSGSGDGSGITEEELEEIRKEIATSLSTAESYAKNYTDGQVKTVNASITTANGKITINANNITTINGKITTINNNISTAQSDIETLKTSIANIDLAADKVTLSSTDENLSSTTDVKAALEKIAAKVWYTKIAITSFTASPKEGLYETGATVSKPTLTWATSKTPTKTTINGTAVTGNSYTLSADITAAKTVTLAVTESEGNTVSASKVWSFGYALYTGMATVPSSFTQDWIKSTLGGKAIKTTAAGTYTMKGSTTSEYWWIVAPTAWTLKFSTTLGEGGAEQVGTLDSFVNDQGKTVPMTIYRASKVQGSDMKITVS